jgi:hypothetical protein
LETDQVIGRRLSGSGSGSVISTDDILINTDFAENAAPDMVYHADSSQYLIVWQQNGDVYSRGVLPNGTVAGSATAIANTAQLETNPRLTQDGEAVLAVWQRQWV